MEKSASSKRDDFLKRNFDFEKFAKSLFRKKTLFVGIGGGCDIITSYAIMKNVICIIEKTCEKMDFGEYFYYAQTKRRPGKTNELLPNMKHLYKVDGVLRSLKGKVTYGTTLLSESLPRSKTECPYVFILPKKHETVKLEEFVQEVKSLKFDLIVGIDAGGDSLTSGTDLDQRDTEMLDCLLKSLDKEQSLLHFVVAPGVDGESSPERMVKAIKERDKSYKGAFRIPPLCIETMRECSKDVKMTRTPNIVVRYYNDENEDEMVTIERHTSSTVPKIWLKYVIVFKVFYNQ